MTNYEDLQAKHQQLLAEIEADPDSDAMLRSVQDYIDQVKVEAENVANPRERDQIRANLRFWAAFVFDRTGTYPSTTLRPPTDLPEPSPIKARNRIFIVGAGALGAVILLILVTVVTYVFMREPVRSEQGQTQVAAINTLNTQIALPAELTAMALQFTATPKATLIDLPSTPSPTSSPTSLISVPTDFQATATPDPRTATVAALITQVLQITPTVTPVGFIPVSGGGGDLELAARVFSETQTELCTSQTVRVHMSINDQVESDEAVEAVVSLSRAGDNRILDSATMSTEVTTTTFDLADLAAADNASFLLRLNHPVYNASNVIFQFSSNCSNSAFLVDYHLELRGSRLLEQPPQNPKLSLDWRLLTWGPAPDPLFGDASDRWVASIMLVAEGGEGESIFWVEENDTNFKPVLDGKILVEGKVCEESRKIVGLTSGGQSTLRELIILSPYCPRELQLDLPDVGLKIID